MIRSEYNKMNLKSYYFIVFFALVVLTSCQQPGGNNTGSEYMPDMAHSIAYEANVYNKYYNNTWDAESVKSLKELSIPRLPVSGTVPRGYAGSAKSDNPNAISVPANGHVPYYYANNEAERARAVAEIIDNPFPITNAGMASAKDLYNIYCGICHGEKGDGAGYLARDGSPYQVQPANFLQDTFYNSTNGRFYHAIMHGKNVMGGYADKLSYEERWQVIHYIHQLMAKEKKLVYNEEVNTLNNVDVPAKTMKPVAEVMEHTETHSIEENHGHQHEGEHHEDGHDHNGGDHDAEQDHSGDDHSHGE